MDDVYVVHYTFEAEGSHSDEILGVYASQADAVKRAENERDRLFKTVGLDVWDPDLTFEERGHGFQLGYRWKDFPDSERVIHRVTITNCVVQ